MLSNDIVIFLLFLAVVATVVWSDRKNIKPTGLVLMRRTQRGRAWLYRTAAQWPRFWKVLTTLGVVITIPAMILISWFLLNSTWQVLSGQIEGAVKLVLPWSGFEEQPGVFFVPWYFWFIGIAAVIAPHELFHGIACRLAKIRIRSLGLMLLLFLPGAFVDPDKRQLDRAPRLAKLRVFAAGSFANFITAALCTVLGILLLVALFNQAGIMPSGLIAGSPAAAANISGAILAIGGMPISSQEDIVTALQRVPIGSTIAVQTTEGNYTITTVQHPERDQSYLGIAGPYNPNYELKAGIASSGFGDAARFFVDLLAWLSMISLGIGLFNLLPIKPLDGGLIFEEIAGKYLKKNALRFAVRGLSLLMVAAVVFNIIGPIILQ